MKRAAAIVAVVGLILTAPALLGAGKDDVTNRLTEVEAESGWKQIFDGKTLDGWGILGNKAGWAVEGGAIACTVKGGQMIYSNDRYKDFMLRSQFKTGPRVNSGIFVRWEDLKDPVDSG